MARTTGIEWCDATWNPVRGCTRVSEGCRNCYAETLAARPFMSGPGKPYEGLARLTESGDARWTGEVMFVEHHIADPLKWREPLVIFVNSMGDVFHETIVREHPEWIAQVFDVMERASQHKYVLLTKRPALMRRWVNARYVDAPVPAHISLGTSVEDDRVVRTRLNALCETNATTRCVSVEPLIGVVHLRPWLDHIAWVKVGAESGEGARPMDDDWVRRVRDDCVDAGTAFFYKQAVVNGRKIPRPELDGRTWTEMPRGWPSAGASA